MPGVHGMRAIKSKNAEEDENDAADRCHMAASLVQLTATRAIISRRRMRARLRVFTSWVHCGSRADIINPSRLQRIPRMRAGVRSDGELKQSRVMVVAARSAPHNFEAYE